MENQPQTDNQPPTNAAYQTTSNTTYQPTTSAEQQQRIPENPSLPFFLMDDILEKLKLLNYEEKFKPLHRLYFCIPNRSNPTEQFVTFIQLVTWILIDKLRYNKFQAPDQFDDPNTTATNIIFELKKLGMQIDFPSSKIRAGYGEAVCYILKKLLNLAINKLHVTVKNPIYPSSIQYSKEDEIVYDDDIDDDADDGIETDDEEEYILDHQKIETVEIQDEDPSSKEIITTEIDPQEWKLDVERLAPQLVLRLHVDHKDWRTHAETLIKDHRTIDESLPSTIAELKKISDEIGKVCDRISRREQMLVDDPVVSSLVSQYKKNKAEFIAVEQKNRELEANIQKLNEEFTKVSQELDEVKTKVDQLSSKMGDASPLKNIKEALVKVKAEIKNMDLQLGIVQHSLLQATLKHAKLRPKEKYLMDGDEFGDIYD